MASAGASLPAQMQVMALMAFADQPKPEAQAALAALRARGLQLRMISGDNRAAALAMGQRLGLAPEEVMAEVLPGQKAERVAERAPRKQVGDREACVCVWGGCLFVCVFCVRQRRGGWQWRTAAAARARDKKTPNDANNAPAGSDVVVM